ncbi:S8 family serine peptidase [Luteitalea sp. TBR-22]|uniref:S8 family peptidase n=1 Tax=Luteitalea sp. TBR-22 TaxID=2802971 RepID=UPI001EF46F2F|nr:S8 family serine peptidase [Luteitalea sp. TBR-22]
MPTPITARTSASLVLDLATYLTECYAAVPLVTAALAGLREPPRRRGAGLHLGLIETALDPRLADLCGASLIVANFAGTTHPARALVDHGTYSASLLVGQGRRHVLGLVPRAHLSVVLVAEGSGVARPSVVARAIDWLSTRTTLVALPLGTTAWDDELAAGIDRAHARGVRVFAAAGNLHPQPILFPARHAGAIAVAALDGAGRLSADGCRWPALDLTAPGVGIPGAIDDDRAEWRSGSSVACVVAAGLQCLCASSRSPPACVPVTAAT